MRHIVQPMVGMLGCLIRNICVLVLRGVPVLNPPEVLHVCGARSMLAGIGRKLKYNR